MKIIDQWNKLILWWFQDYNDHYDSETDTRSSLSDHN